MIIADTIEMTGTEKQIAYANDIRTRLATEFTRFVSAAGADPQPYHIEMQAKVHAAIDWNNGDATYWIAFAKKPLMAVAR